MGRWSFSDLFEQSSSRAQREKFISHGVCGVSGVKSIKMFTNKPTTAVTKLRTTLFVILIVQKIAEIYSKPAIGMGGLMGPAPFGYWGSKPPPPKSNYFRLDKPLEDVDKNPFDISDEDDKLNDNFLSSEEDDEDNEIDTSNENKKGRGGGGGGHGGHGRRPRPNYQDHRPSDDDTDAFDKYGYDPVIEQASLPQLQNIFVDLNKDEPAPSLFSFSFRPLFSTLFRKMFCFVFHHDKYCVPDNIFATDPWFEGYRSKKT